MMSSGKKSKGFSYRPKRAHAPLLADLAEATERPKSYFLDKALEKVLPELERQYAKELQELNKAKEISPHQEGRHFEMNDRANYGHSEEKGSIHNVTRVLRREHATHLKQKK